MNKLILFNHYLVFVLVLLFGRVHAQVNLVRIELPSCFNEISHNYAISGIFQDRRGFIWVTSSLGLMRYDGYEFKYYYHDKNDTNSIANPFTTMVREDSKGNLWFGLWSGGLSCYNPVTDKFRNYNTKAIAPESNDPILALYIDSNDDVWFSLGYRGLCHLDPKTGIIEQQDVITAERCPNMLPHKIRLHNFLMDITERDRNNLWLGTPEGLFSFNKKNKQFTVMRPKTQKGLDVDIYNAKNIITDGHLVWLGGWRSGIQCYDTISKTWTDYSLLNSNETLEINNIINCMIRKDKDEFWIASLDKGLGTFNTLTKKFYFYKYDSSYSYLPKLHAYHLFSDRQKNLFIVYSSSVFCFKQKPEVFKPYSIPTYEAKNHGQANVSCIYEEKSKRFIYVGTYFSDGVICYDRLTGTKRKVNFTFKGKKQIIDYPDQLLERDSESIWLLTADRFYIYYFKTDKLELPPQPKLVNEVRGINGYTCMISENNEILWLGTQYNGLIKYNIKNGVSEYFATTEKDTAQVGSIYVHVTTQDVKRNIWYGNTRASMLACFNTKTRTSTYFDKEGKPCPKANSVVTYSLYTYGNYVYACTNAGLFIFDAKGETPKLKRKIGKENNFITNAIFFIAKENDSLFWLQTVLGVYRYNLHNNLYEKFTSNEGMDFTSTAITSSNLGSFFICSIAKFYEYDSSVKIKRPAPVEPSLTSFLINETSVNYFGELQQNNRIVIEPGYSYFSVSYSSLDFSNTPDIRYSYMLQGFHSDWIDAGNRRYATFTNLVGGNYVLKLRATIDNGITYSKVIDIPIYIETIYYKTWWFRLTLALLFSAVIFSVYKYRTAQQHAIDLLNTKTQLLEKEKSVVQYENLKQQLNPHFLFNSLTSLSSLISIDPKVARQFVDQMSKIYRYILKSSEHETVSLISEISFASTYVKLQQTRFSTGFVVNLKVSDEYNDRKIVPVTIQNMIENAIKHNIIDSESPLVIDIYVEDEYLIVKNNLQKKSIVESSNKMGLEKIKTLYKYLIDKPIIIIETGDYFMVKIPLI